MPQMKESGVSCVLEMSKKYCQLEKEVYNRCCEIGQILAKVYDASVLDEVECFWGNNHDGWSNDSFSGAQTKNGIKVDFEFYFDPYPHVTPPNSYEIPFEWLSMADDKVEAAIRESLELKTKKKIEKARLAAEKRNATLAAKQKALSKLTKDEKKLLGLS